MKAQSYTLKNASPKLINRAEIGGICSIRVEGGRGISNGIQNFGRKNSRHTVCESLFYV